MLIKLLLFFFEDRHNSYARTEIDGDEVHMCALDAEKLRVNVKFAKMNWWKSFKSNSW
jgi:hypothetical protein